MDSTDFNNAVCRICLDENVFLDWSKTIEGHEDVTYKDCYYKYTQIKCLDYDLFSTMLCRNCSKSLQNIHDFILKALDSYKFLVDVNYTNIDAENSYIVEEIETYPSNEFETVLVEKPDTESITEEQYEFENSDEEMFFMATTMSPDEIEDSKTNFSTYTTTVEIMKTVDVNTKYEEFSDDINIKENNSEDESQLRTANRNSKRKMISNNTESKKPKLSSSINLKDEQTFELQETKINNGARSKSKGKKINSQNTPSMCSICSKILHNKYALEKHERTHEKRERTVPCPICGVKFFEQANVVNHMHIHNDNRKKKHSCEFCGKKFFQKGSLNVHRRVHLGQMLKCSICSKEFYRRVDLEIHMNFKHSVTGLNGKTKKRSRFSIRCKYCNKSIRSTTYKSHTAAHLNTPLMKCTLCNKEFYTRGSCTEHLKNTHQKKTFEEYNEYIITYDKNRLSHLLLTQTADIIPNDEE